MRSLFLAPTLLLAALSAAAGLLTPSGVSVLDQTGSPASTLSSNGTIGMSQRVNNSRASANRIVFSFQILSPTGGAAFTQNGNAVPGTVGNSQTSLTGVPIASFYTTPGNYTLKATASLDGQQVTQTQVFSISSPNIILTYPPNGSQGLTDNPLTFRWVSSGGGASYRITVSDNISFYNDVSFYQQTVAAGQGSYTYPANPPNPSQQLTTGQNYYWKIESLDNSGNVLAASQPPFSFSVANSALSRDLAVISLAVAGPTDSQGNIPFAAVVKDQGNTTESNVPLLFTLGGLTPPGSPATITSISPGVSQTFNFSAAIPPGQTQSLAAACLQFFDNVMSNNCQSMAVSPASVVNPGPGAGAGSGNCSINQTADQIWAQIQSYLQSQGIDLSLYQLTSMEGSLNACELAALLAELKAGQVQITLSGPTQTPVPVSPGTPVSTTAAAPASVQSSTATTQEGQEWSGMSQSLSRNLRTFTIMDDDVWQRLWPHFSPDPLPSVDFGRYSVVGIIAGKFDEISDIRIEDVSRGRGGLRVRYSISGEEGIESSGSQGRGEVPYILRVTPRAGREAQFQQLSDKTENERSSP